MAQVSEPNPRPEAIPVQLWNNFLRAKRALGSQQQDRQSTLEHLVDQAERMVRLLGILSLLYRADLFCQLPLTKYPQVIMDDVNVRDTLHDLRKKYKAAWGAAKGDWDNNVKVIRDTLVEVSKLRSDATKVQVAKTASNRQERVAASEYVSNLKAVEQSKKKASRVCYPLTAS